MQYDAGKNGSKYISFIGDTLEDVLGTTTNLRVGLHRIKKEHSSVEITGFLRGNDSGISYLVNMSGPELELMRAAKVLFETAGVPNCTMGDYTLLESTLNSYGKTQKRKFSGALVCKHVVDL